METSNLNYTEIANNQYLLDIHNKSFQTNPISFIARVLREDMKRMDCWKYLKRYIAAKLHKPDPSFEECRQYIIDSFRASGTPASFSSSTQITAAAKNWMTNAQISRESILLIGLGLDMKPSHVNELLTKGIFEQEINPKNPQEVICWYCYRYCTEEHGYYTLYQQLWDQYMNLARRPAIHSANSQDTSYMQIEMEKIQSVTGLMQYLAPLKLDKSNSKFSATSYRKFKELYNKIVDIIAEDKIDYIKDENVIESLKHKESQEDETQKKAAVTDECRVQNYLYLDVKRSDDGYLQKQKDSQLKDLFHVNRLTTKRLKKLIAQEYPVTRYDLITLKFLDICLEYEEYVIPANNNANEERVNNFMEDANKILMSCFMHPIIPQNPYEAFLLRCLATDDPREVYNKVLAQSYNDTNKEKMKT